MSQLLCWYGKGRWEEAEDMEKALEVAAPL